jgi:NAD(P)-dependent dehydrogenase (short-subunit alcohol dehydrogenase family)
MSHDAENTAKRWLITGVSTGLGRELMRAALARGDLVAGTLRDMSQKAQIEALAPGRAFAIRLDMDDAERAIPAVDEAIAALGGGLDIVVNNAAFGIYGPVEVCTENDFRRVMETNFFGLLRVTRACLPALRGSRGTIVNFSSISGLVGHAGTAVYNVSKFAVEGLSEALAEELEPLGVKVMVVNPDRFKSDFHADRALHLRFDTAGVYDGTPAGQVAQRLDEYVGNEPGDPAKLAAVVLAALAAPRPPFSLLVGPYGYVSVQAKIDRLKSDMETWRALSTATSFDK